MGYFLAGFHITGVDIAPQPHYPFDFIQADALDYLAEHGHEYDAIHTSPPCQAYSVTAGLPQCQKHEYPTLIEPVRKLLIKSGKPYIIENVVGAPLNTVTQLCGLAFNLKVFRHRLFESNILLLAPPHPSHREKQIGKDGFCCVAGHGDSSRKRIAPYYRRKATWADAMDIHWMNKFELTQAIPPAYTKWIGRQLITYIRMTQ